MDTQKSDIFLFALFVLGCAKYREGHLRVKPMGSEFCGGTLIDFFISKSIIGNL